MAGFQSSNDDDWTFCSSKSVFSIDSGEESQNSSNLRPPFTFLPINESFDDSDNMSFSTGSKDLNSSQAFRPHLTDINEWVQRQSEATQASLKPNANSNELPGSTSTNPIPKSEVPAPLSEGFSQCSKLTPGSSSVYDISTLLELGTTTSSDQMELRIRPAALAEDIFKNKPHDGSSKSFVKSRYRGLSEDSDLSHQSLQSEDDVMLAQNSHYYSRPPFRQPLSPPETTTIQQYEGFKRFLKQVASPPHQRVTAGGRIVPAGPQSPPPMMNFGSIDATLSRPLAPKQSARQVNNSSGPTDFSRISKSQTQSFVPPGGNILGCVPNPKLSSHPSQPAPIPWDHNGWDRSGPPNGDLSVTLPAPAPADMVPVLFLPAGDAVILCNGVYSRVFHNGQNLIPDPLPNNTSYVTPSEHPASVCNQIPHGRHAFPSFGGPNPKTKVAPISELQASNHTSNNDLKKNYEKLRSQLSKLDRHMASHFHKLAQSEVQTLAAQRERLVEQIDFLRVNKDKVPVQLPTSGMQPYQYPGTFAYSSFVAAPVTNPNNSNQQTSEYATSYAHEAAQMASSSYSFAGKPSCLSPDAPSFIPSTTAPIFDHSSSYDNLGNVTQDEKSSEKDFLHKNDVSWKPITIQTANVLGDLRDGVSPKVDDKKLGMSENTDDSAVAASYTSTLTHEDVEYVDRIGLNPLGGDKLVCSTIEEFQEVIRLVRKQAKLYGCNGGQSKDPEYDAEEDIRWAMKDYVPIPLPTMIPDYVLRPRPWDWNDSFFNPINHEDGRYPITWHKDMVPDIQEHNHEERNHGEWADPNLFLAANDKERVPVTDPIWGQNPRQNDVGLSQEKGPKSKYETDPSPLARASEVFDVGVSLTDYKIIPSAKPSDFPSFLESGFDNGEPEVDTDKILTLLHRWSQNDEELKFYLNDGYDPQFSDGGRYTAKYQELLFAVQHKDPHSMRKVLLLNPEFDLSTHELIFADGGPPGYEKDMARYAEKYGKEEAKSRLDALRPWGNIHAMTSEGKPVHKFNHVKMTLKIVDGDERGRILHITPYEMSDPAFQEKYATSIDAQLAKFAESNPIMKSLGVYPPPHVKRDQGKTTSHTSPRKPNSASTFLEGMLKNPRFSTPTRKFADWTPEERRRYQLKISGIVEDPEDADEMKENLETHSQHDASGGSKAFSPALCSSVPTLVGQDIRHQKAQSSLASSNYNACGYLPQYNRAGASLGISSNQSAENSRQYGTSRNDPSRPSSVPYTTKRGGNTNHLSDSRGMGLYDGADDSPLQPRALEENVTGNHVSGLENPKKSTTRNRGSIFNGVTEQARPPFDYQGVTADDFNTCGRVFAPGYRTAISRFFDKLRKQEHEITTRAQEAKPKASQSSNLDALQK